MRVEIVSIKCKKRFYFFVELIKNIVLIYILAYYAFQNVSKCCKSPFLLNQISNFDQRLLNGKEMKSLSNSN